MKKNLFAVMLFAFTLISCDSLSKFTQFEMPFTSSVTISKSTPINLPFNLPTPEIKTNSSTFFSTNNINTDLIDAIYLKKLDLTVTSPTNGNFNFLKSIEVYIAADSLPDTKIASLNNIPNNAAMPLSLTVEQEDLKQFIMKDKFSLKVKTTTDEILTSDHEIDIKSVFRIDVKVLGL